MDEDEDEALGSWLILLRTPGMGGATLRAGLARAHGDARALLARLRGDPGRLPPSARAWLLAPDRALLDADRDWLAAPRRRLLRCDDEDFPPQLETIAAPPAALFVDGDASLLLRPQLAIVGARAASAAGLAQARSFAAAVAAAGLLVTSGLADGIDGAAHRGALEQGQPTVAVVGTGPDLVYPRKHAALSQLIADHGAIVSEFPPGTPAQAAQAAHFPRRNRLIAGLGLGTLVIEASLRSGSLITAALAAEQGREVFALPGSIHNPLARGCHQLIRDGAWLVEEPRELLQILAPAARALGAELASRLRQAAPAQAEMAADSIAPAWLLAALGHDPVDLDELSRRTGEPVARLSAILLTLELEGRLAALPGNRYQRVGA